MKFYDEQQKKIRYQFGYYSMLLMATLLLVYIAIPDASLGGISYRNAIMIIIMITALFFLVNVVYRNAFFDLYTRRPFWSNAFFLAMAGLQAQQAYQLYQLGMDLPDPINTVEFVMMHGLKVALHLSIPLTYGVRAFVDWLSAKEQNTEETGQSS
ncbi:hypothetical protein [Trichococcus pasteurii]|uniref:Uncharacterized protein n=1 Tax=Trichococcus pasteurii TaxID=43064 RepID=A0A1W1IHI2_9LACT|nr:hypothetical protein [Trichococcus pasteurii]SLM52369.1 Hypothetical protein TPAS_2063 [Trichococcus pasteurii]SSB93250.1 Hypothetical protein TPAS_2063 [Trichococcus pasteurii]